MNNYCLLVILIFVTVPRTKVYCFNIEDRYPFVKKSLEDDRDTYFGFSVAQHKTQANSSSVSDNWILVGAPLGQNLQPGSNYSGALFKCPMSNYDNDCEQIETDGQRQPGGRYLFEDFDYGEATDDSLKPPGVDELKNGQWLGVTVKSQKPGGLVMVCAHRYIQSTDLSKFHFGQGLCYLLDHDLKAFESLQYCKGRPTEKLHQQYGFCQIGTSAAFIGDDFALVGAPGPFTWRGTIFGQVVVGDFLQRDKTVYQSPLNDNPTPIDKYSYLGMSVGGGHFFDKTRYTYVSGAPRSQMIGQVYFFEKNRNQPTNSELLNISLIITGEQFASSFGYEILAGDFNNDGYDDLLVGAPFYYADKKGGAVYIYYNLRNCRSGDSCKWDKVLYGVTQSRFGFAMTSLGDINKDGYNDVAIGAPYEDGHGAVYIFLGSQNGVNEEPSQVIRIKQVKTLGYSLSGGLDMDNNGYPDLLVGAYESNKALLFKTRPIIDIKIEIVGEELQNINASRKGCSADPENLNNTCFSFQSCFSIMGLQKKTEKFSVRYHIQEEKKIVSRIWFLDEQHVNKKSWQNSETIAVSSYSKKYCQDETVYIKEGVSDILSPIKFKVKYSLENNKYNTPILNKTSLRVFEANFQKDCGDDDVCESYLVLSAGTNLEQNNEGQYTVNLVNEEFVLEANVSNFRESAYEAKLFVFHPEALSYIALKTDESKQTNIKCSFRNNTLVVCDLGNPFRGNSTANLKLRFEIKKNTKEKQLDLRIFVNSTSTELSKQTSQNIVAILQKIAEFSIIGKASSNLFYGGKITGESGMKYLEDIGARVTHKYQIDNHGEWTLPDIKVHIRWPYQVSPGPEGREGKWLLYLESVPVVAGNGVSGICAVRDNSMVNTLHLNLSSTVLDEPENLMLPDEFLKNELMNENDTLHSFRRKRRDIEYVVPTQITERGGKKRKIVVMDCMTGTAKCADIECHIKKLARGNQAQIDIKSRIWNSTLVEDYSEVDWVQIKSIAEVFITDSTFIISANSISRFSAETIAYPEIVISDSGLNWWIIGGAVLAGLLLLIVLVVILYKCGFFKRKRVSKDPTLSGNLLMKEENDKLLRK